jgi:hypothetical protein
MTETRELPSSRVALLVAAWVIAALVARTFLKLQFGLM